MKQVSYKTEIVGGVPIITATQVTPTQRRVCCLSLCEGKQLSKSGPVHVGMQPQACDSKCIDADV